MRIGSLFSGYGGLDMAVAAHYDATLAWHVEFDKHPSAILAHHFPDVPNHGDVTAVDWAAVEPVDIITGGYPCQPFSHAGQRRGTTDERHLWPYVADCLRVLRPRVAVFENVAGHLTLGFDTVLADLAALGFDAVWGVVSAAEAGAAHRRQRLFIVATDATRERGDRGWGTGPQRWAESPDSSGRSVALLPTPTAQAAKHGSSPDVHANGYGSNLWDLPTLLPTPKASDGPNGGPGMRNGRGQADALPGVVTLLPTPTASDARDGQHVRQMTLDAIERGASKGVNLNHLVEGDLPPGGVPLLPTPQARDHKDQYVDNAGCHRPDDTDSVPRAVRDLPATDFGPYSAAIARWATVIGRPAPAPTEPGQNGRPRLSPAFVEWLMGLPDGWVTGVDIPRSAQLKALGNGVVPAQALLALQLLERVA